jgi:hypothetical protein
METIEPATVGDIPQLVNLLTLLFTQEADFRPDRAKQDRGLRLLIESPSAGIVFVARARDQVVGMVSWKTWSYSLTGEAAGLGRGC